MRRESCLDSLRWIMEMETRTHSHFKKWVHIPLF
jgi:hypothetical protein